MEMDTPIKLNVDCLETVFSFLEDDIRSVHACMFVSRTWFKPAARLLWRDPCRASKPEYRPSPLLIDTILQCLAGVDERRVLHRMGLRVDGELPMIDYLAFVQMMPVCKVLQTLYSRLLRGKFTFGRRVKRLIRFVSVSRRGASAGDVSDGDATPQDEALRHARLLFRLIVAHCRRIRQVNVSEDFLLLNKPRIMDVSAAIDKDVLRHVTEFTLNSIENRDALLAKVAGITTSLQTIRFAFNSRSLQQQRMGIAFNGLVKLIEAQKRLKHIHIRGFHVDGFTIMAALRTQAAWIETVEFTHVDMTRTNPQFDEEAAFPFCPNLRELSFRGSAVDVPTIFREFDMGNGRLPLRRLDFTGTYIPPSAIRPLVAASSDNLEIALLGVSDEASADNDLLHLLSHRSHQLQRVEVHGANLYGNVIRLLMQTAMIESLILLPWRGFERDLTDDFLELANREITLRQLRHTLIEGHVVDIGALSMFVARCAPDLQELCVVAVGFAKRTNRLAFGLDVCKYDRATIQYSAARRRMDVTYYKNERWGHEHPSVSLTSPAFTREFQLIASDLLRCLRVEVLKVRYEAALDISNDRIDV